jgi:hypothetical protein
MGGGSLIEISLIDDIVNRGTTVLYRGMCFRNVTYTVFNVTNPLLTGVKKLLGKL